MRSGSAHANADALLPVVEPIPCLTNPRSIPQTFLPRLTLSPSALSRDPLRWSVFLTYTIKVPSEKRIVRRVHAPDVRVQVVETACVTSFRVRALSVARCLDPGHKHRPCRRRASSRPQSCRFVSSISGYSCTSAGVILTPPPSVTIRPTSSPGMGLAAFDA